MKKTHNSFILSIILIIILALTLFNTEWLSNKFADILEKNPQVAIKAKNRYTKDYGFEFVQNAESFKPYGKQDLINIIYTVINNGWETFTFYCPEEYSDCVTDINIISEDEVLLTHINNFTHPFNNFKKIIISYYENGEILLEINKIYTQNQINKIDVEIDKIMNEILVDDMELVDKIKTLHDYIIDNSDYDIIRNEKNTSPYYSDNAFGIFFQGYGICSGYSDAMAIFLEKLKVKNMKILSDTHVWNGVYINDEWLHLDLTWDDPVSKDGKDTLWHKFFLINNEDLIEMDKETEDHIFNKLIYLEYR